MSFTKKYPSSHNNIFDKIRQNRGNSEPSLTTKQEDDVSLQPKLEEADGVKDSEQEYLDALKELMEYGSEITSRERRMLDKIRHGLGISEARVKELEAFVSPQSPSLLPITANGVTCNMVYVEGGTFQMGASDNDSDACNDEKPAHQVTLPSFYIGETEVTQELWQAVMGSNPSYYTGNLQCPVEQVTWIDCHTFLSKLNALTGKNFRLPTEAEWEFAARGGNKSEGYDYAGGEDIDQVAWYGDNSGGKTRPVATKAPNELGIYDMCGNVKEWCWDAWERLDDPSSVTNPTGRSKIDKDTFFILRGGEYDDEPEYCTVFDRSDDAPNRDVIGYGLRVVRTASKEDLEAAQEAEKPSEAKKARPALKNKRAQGRAKRK